MKDSMFIGLDVHKATIFVAAADGERGREVRDWGKFSNRGSVMKSVYLAQPMLVSDTLTH